MPQPDINYWAEDNGGIKHFHSQLGQFADVKSAAAFALIDCPPGCPVWFWFNDTPAPIFPGDTPEVLFQRWAQWRTDCQSGKLLACLLGMAGIKDSIPGRADSALPRRGPTRTADTTLMGTYRGFVEGQTTYGTFRQALTDEVKMVRLEVVIEVLTAALADFAAMAKRLMQR